MTSLAWSLQKFEQLDSTQNYILNNLNSLDEGACVQAATQTRGKGRHGRYWSSPEGNLYFSFLLKPKISKADYGQIALLAGLAVAQALHPYVNVVLKWPNDVLVGGQKICGILIESVEGALVVGLGVNVTHSPFEGAANLADFKLSPDTVRDIILEKFALLYDRYISDGFEDIRREWLSYSFDTNSVMSVKIGDNKITGLYQGLDKAGYLLLLCDKSSEVITISSGDVFQNYVTSD